MAAVVVEPITGPAEVLAGLRAWAAGFRADEAAVELLAAVARGLPVLLAPATAGVEPWLLPCPRPGWWFLEGAVLAEQLEGLPGRLRPVLAVVAGLATDGALVDLGVTLAGVPAEWRGPVFAALGHAAGCPGLQLVAADPEGEGLFPWVDGAGLGLGRAA